MCKEVLDVSHVLHATATKNLYRYTARIGNNLMMHELQVFFSSAYYKSCLLSSVVLCKYSTCILKSGQHSLKMISTYVKYANALYKIIRSSREKI